MNSDDTTSQVCISHTSEPCFLDQIGKLLLLGEHPDGLDKVLVRVAIACYHRAKFRDNVERVEIIELLQSRHNDF